jgi:hypothetical protein
MSFFDFFFPEQAQASHLRTIAESQRLQSVHDSQRRFREERDRRWESSRSQDLEKRVEELEQDLGQAGLVIEALLQLLEESGTLKRVDVAKRAIEVDMADGVRDGKISGPAEALRGRPFLSHRKWDEEKRDR